MKPTPKKKQPVKARKIRGIQIDHTRIDMDTRYFVLPATQEAYDAMVEQCASMIFVPLHAPKGDTNRIARAVLAAIGITLPGRAT